MIRMVTLRPYLCPHNPTSWMHCSRNTLSALDLSIASGTDDAYAISYPTRLRSDPLFRNMKPSTTSTPAQIVLDILRKRLFRQPLSPIHHGRLA